MARPCTVCRHPERNDIDSVLLNGGSLRSVAKRFRISATAVFRRKRDHIARALIRAAEATAELQEITRGEHLLEQVRDLNERTLRILKEAEATGDSRTALAAVGEARGNAELLCRMLMAIESARREEESTVISEDFVHQIDALLHRGDVESPSTKIKTLNFQSGESREEWIDRMAKISEQTQMPG